MCTTTTKMENSNKNPMTDAERLELAAKLDEDLENFINGLEKRQYTEGWPEDRWQEEMEKHPFFMKKAPEAGEELSPLMEGLQKLKYDPEENTPEELANAYKEDGNFNFKHKNYRLAIIAYTEAIKIKCGNPDIDATLHNNRSAANYFLKNYRSALRDAELALKYKPDYNKAAIRAANCLFEMNQYEKAVEYCDKLLSHNPEDKEILQLRQECINASKNRDRDLRKREQLERKKNKANDELIKEILSRGVNIERGKDGLKLEALEPHVPELASHRVFLNETGALVWPVIFMYPEYKIMDFIQGFREDETFQEHVHQVFEEHPEWDTEKKYTPNNINVYFENYKKSKLYTVDVNKTLAEILKLKQFIVRGGTPSFLLLVRGSPAEKTFLEQYGVA